MIKIEDFKEGGSKRKYITHIGVLSEVDGNTLSDEQKTTLLRKCYTMCDGYIAQPAEDETTGDETGKTEEAGGETTEDETGKTEEKSQDEGISTLK